MHWNNSEERRLKVDEGQIRVNRCLEKLIGDCLEKLIGACYQLKLQGMKSHENIFEWRDQEKIKKIIQHFENGMIQL